MFEYVVVSGVRRDAYGAISCTFSTLAEAESFATSRGEICKIWKCSIDGWQDTQRLVMEFI